MVRENGGPPRECSEELSYLEELRLATIVRKSMVGNGMCSSRESFERRSCSTRGSLTKSISFRDGIQRNRSSLVSNPSSWMSTSMKKSMKGYVESESGVDKEPRVASNGGISSNEDWRRSSLSDSDAWKSMAKFVVELDSDSESDSHIGNAHDLENENHSGVNPLYAKPVQRQLWGDPHLVVHIGWNTLFFDLFYVAAAYNLGNLLISVLNEEQSIRGVIYIVGIFGGIYNIFLRCMMYDSQFSVDDHAHRVLEVVRIFLVSMVVLHIKSVDLLMDPKSVEAFALTTAMFAETLVHVLLNLELYWLAEGDTIAIQNQTKRELITHLLPSSLLYLAASIMSGYLYFHDAFDHKDGNLYEARSSDGYNTGSDKDDRILGADYADVVATTTSSSSFYSWNVADVPIVLCFVASVTSIAIQGISAIKLSPKNPDIRAQIVPMNIDFFIHRFGEFTMLFFGEAIMGLLIVETTESYTYYVVAMVGVLNVIVLQASKYDSEPHGEAEEHCLRKGLQPFFAYSLLTQSLCLGLIAFAVSFKVGLNILVLEHKENQYDGYGGNNYDDVVDGIGYDGYGSYADGHSNNSTFDYGNDYYDQDYGKHRALRALGGGVPTVSAKTISILYCSSLTIVLISIEMMSYLHKGGLMKTYSLFASKGNNKTKRKRVQWKRFFGTLFKIGLLGLVSTLYLWVKHLGFLVSVGIAISIVFDVSKVIEHILETRAEEMKKIAGNTLSMRKFRDSITRRVRRRKHFSSTIGSRSTTIKSNITIDSAKGEENSANTTQSTTSRKVNFPYEGC
uniref:Uncharacterized protein n=1 Tax=Pseudo-nitzschia australis TaxID=44445 RepID=A0A7S4AHK8_9STRA|mmetsp:Transcript_2335/g.4710  ORF Transcript_2335/g.4710 Transcript_2335/m.4710 type:complete len:791 (-) Transcript_2335:85-2457(-)